MTGLRSHRLLSLTVTLTAWYVLCVYPAEAWSQNASAGSSVPCAVPLVWSIDHVDPRFGLSEAEAVSATEAAASLWEDASGRRLFRRGDQPMRVGFHFDDWQALVQLQRQMEAELEERRAALEALDRSYRRVQEAYLQRVDAHESRRPLQRQEEELQAAFQHLQTEMARLNDDIRDLNRRGEE